MSRNGKGSIERRYIDWKRLGKNHDRMKWPMKQRVYRVHGRNGYYAVDEYKSDTHSSVTRTVASDLTKKVAELLASEIESAIYYFIKDNDLEEK